MRHLPVDGPFDAVVCWLNSFGYYDDADCHRVLEEFHRVLRPGGVVTIDTLHHDGGVRHYTPAPDAVAVQRGDDTMIELWTFDPVSGRMYIERTAHRDGEVRHASYFVRLPTPPEWVVWLEAAGFRDVRFQAGGGGPARGRQLGDGGRGHGLRPGRRTGREPAAGPRREPGRSGTRPGPPATTDPSPVGCVVAVGPTGRSGRTAVMTAGIAAWGTYLPYWRLQRSAIGAVLGSGGGRGTRAVASYDEDTTTLGVEAGRRALAVGPGAAAVQDLFLSTPDPGYLDKTSATTVHAALGLRRACGAYDFAGSSRSAVATLLQAFVGAGRRRRTTMAVVSDLRTGLAGSAEERDSGDGAAAFVCAPDGRGGRARRARRGERRVPRPLAGARRGRLPRVGGAFRRGDLRARWPGRPSPPR